MAAIVGVLFFYDGKELPQWNLGITLNGFVSVFSNIAKASLLLPTAEALGQHRWNWFSKESRSLMDFEVLDAASRGPWGSLLLLLRAAQVRGLTLASIGAAIILLCLPLDLFFQQIIVYPNVWVEVASPATIPRAITYSVVAGQYTQNNQTLGNADVIMSQVVQPFFYLNGTTPNLNVHCPTSNCTWDPFETLAVCSACDSRISQELEFGCVTGSGDWLTDVSDYYNKTSFPNITQCGYFLNLTSDNPVLMTGYVVDPISSAIGDVLETRLFPLVDAITRERYYQGSYAFKDVVDPILDFLIVGTPGGLEAIHRNETPVAHECVLTWCTQTIHSSFLWGKLSQNVSATFLNDTKREFPFTFGEDAADYIYNANISLTPPEQHLSPIPKSGGQPPNITFGVDNTTALQTIFLTDTIAPSFITIPSSAGGSQVKIDTVDAIGAHVRPLAKNLWLPPYGNTTHYVERIAETMTNTIRNSPAVDGSLVTVTGTAWDMRTHVKVRWAWVILPLVLLVFSLVFLIITVARSSREVETVGIWKTSAIAILFNGLDDDARKNVTPNCRMGEARTKARQLRVRLVPE
ncbi:hypothetical protein EJ08DRAFT_588311 [Tothia fuscella]|uniref:Uncharacterized protein n=1 Tax=Tothia fuscella TaxID=1048955 RepID=A0A9P4TY27_9PEZI|nr:hypothetical protein EJ08DRAFT_588311 [Tothia fuscella]